jgi:hypothetical protein
MSCVGLKVLIYVSESFDIVVFSDFVGNGSGQVE